MKETRPRPRKATGPGRPRYLDASDNDRIMAVLLALIVEVAAMRERLDTHEQVSNLTEAVENYAAPAEVEEKRDQWRDAYIKRLFRVISEDIEALKRKAGEPK